jgi:hypothetical protein
LQLVVHGLEKSQKFEEEVRRPPQKPEEKKKPEEERAVLVAELREIYAQALPQKAEVGPVAATVNEAAVEPQGETSPPKGSGLVEETDHTDEVEAEAAEPPRPQVHYALRPKPGQFGRRPQYVRVAVPVGEGE